MPFPVSYLCLMVMYQDVSCKLLLQSHGHLPVDMFPPVMIMDSPCETVSLK